MNGAEAVIIVGRNNEKLQAAELELGSFGKVTTNNTDIADSAQLDLDPTSGDGIGFREGPR